VRILILGHTAFLGRALLHEAAARGDDVTLLTRSRVDRHLFPTVEFVDGSAPDDLSRIGGRSFEAILDLSAGSPNNTLHTALALADRCEQYTLVSSISVYRDFARSGMDEASAVAVMPEGSDADDLTDHATLGARLASCELRLAEVCPEKAMIVRPGLLAGPFDPTERLPRLIRRVEGGGEVLAGSDPDQPVQLLDVRDLAGFLLSCAAARATGLVNAVGGVTTLRDLCETVADVTHAGAEFYFAPDHHLARAGLEPMNHLPFWVPQAGYPGYFRVSGARAASMGLFPRPLADTVRDAVQHVRHAAASGTSLHLPPKSLPMTTTLPRAAEQRIIDEYKRQSNGRHAHAVA
jgi:2'-hydroxyisoflavone reductase